MSQPIVDVVIVTYNSRDRLRAAVAPLADLDWIRIIAVDNGSTDRSLEAISDLSATVLPQLNNLGFGAACNVGWRAGAAPFVFFLNPDVRVIGNALGRLVEVLQEDPRVAAIAPRIMNDQGRLDFSLRRFPRAASTFAQALFLHRLFPTAEWSDEVIRDEAAYEIRSTANWVSGACILVRRAALEDVGGFDEGFFMYCEDTDLCRRLRDAGWRILFEPTALVVHEGGASAPRSSLLPVLAASRIRYARKHRGRGAALVERLGVALGEFTHSLLGRGDRAARVGHLRALWTVLSDVEPPRPA